MIIDEVHHQFLLGVPIFHRGVGAPGLLPSNPVHSPALTPRREVFHLV
jgi:hypothetical protein